MKKPSGTYIRIRLQALEGRVRSGNAIPVREGVPMEFHISRAVREKYSFDRSLFAISGNVVFADFPAVREFAARVNEKRNTVKHPERALRAGQLNAMGLVDEILHYVAALYRESCGNEVFAEALSSLEKKFGPGEVGACLAAFVDGFPPLKVHLGEAGAEEYLRGSTDGIPNRVIALEELLLLWLANDNPAFALFGELFDDTDLRGTTPYLQMIGGLKDFFDAKPKFGPRNQNLIDMMKAPSVASPYSLSGQLDFIRRHWGLLLGRYLERLLRSMDVIREEDKARWGGGPGPTQVYEYTGADYADEEFERFSPDKDWMPKVVLIAKSSLVWLDQLSRRYGRRIATLDAIPDEELDTLASRGINGLWLIGLWERSRASKRIKELCGNPEAAASAYSLHEYEVAGELGGWGALADLRKRAWKRGIRLASDMVPNHTGIDSQWMIEHPDWFIQSSHPPFPGYSFNGENLSGHHDVGLYLEDHYYDRTDAAVVFKRVHLPSGDTRYIYHGNDGTHMPWNDTAQLNFLLKETREAVIRTILHVARNFPIIRFDAAMTLAKRHYQRLWYPEPGSGGDIPSRAERGLTREEFNRVFPTEFWRELVDRAAAECPDTLLLAEAFWMMEGYFVRTLGMHRVYNSAFMNMLKNEENDKYRASIKNTQEFDRNILKRHVNFMNNPDEDTAIAQFGDGDKYFGVCTLMVTMPGLPMFGHGQIEGFREKYGMEFRRAYQDESPNLHLVERHERDIFPLVKKRYLFADVENFLLYDMYGENGAVNENVIAFTNRRDSEAALVLYNNAYPTVWGWIRMSAAYLDRTLVQRNLGEGLGVHAEKGWYCIFREQRSNRWFIRASRDLHRKGLFVRLQGYESQVFLDMYEVLDDKADTWRRFAESLDGAGVESIEEALREITYGPVYAALRPLYDGWYPKLQTGIFGGKPSGASPAGWEDFRQSVEGFLEQARIFGGGERAGQDGTEAVLAGLEAASRVFRTLAEKPGRGSDAGWRFLAVDGPGLPGARELVFSWALCRGLGYVPFENGRGRPEAARRLAEEWSLDREAVKFFAKGGAGPETLERLRLLLNVLLSKEDWFERAEKFVDPAVRARSALENLFADMDVQRCAGVNRFEDTVYFNREGFLALIWWLCVIALVRRAEGTKGYDKKSLQKSGEVSLLNRWLTAYGKAEYRLTDLLEILDPGV